MTAPRFVHLRLHTEYSIVDGMARVDDAVDSAAADGMPALAITDLANVFGAIKFYMAARAKGVQPIAFHIDCDVMLRRLPAYIGALVPDAALAVLQALPRFHPGDGKVAEPSDAPKSRRRGLSGAPNVPTEECHDGT